MSLRLGLTPKMYEAMATIRRRCEDMGRCSPRVIDGRLITGLEKRGLIERINGDIKLTERGAEALYRRKTPK